MVMTKMPLMDCVWFTDKACAELSRENLMEANVIAASNVRKMSIKDPTA